MASKLDEGEATEVLLGVRSLYDSHPYAAAGLRRRRRSSAAASVSCMYYDTVFLLLIALLVLTAVGAFLWPSKPRVSVIGLQFVQAEIRNPDLVSRNYSTISASVSYEGASLANATADAVSLDPRNSSTVLLPIQFSLNTTSSNGTADLGLAIAVGGEFEFLMFNIYVEGKKSCTIGVNTENQTIAHQNCYE
ncbi:unnamed protein product [Spirodela intermedia]|uniref:Late embryogenesis abundant protein LEA-2 subgroup domain-containing protein n=1 Tax=Spirodela intermedia TaxID=51605 RepID=A0A7I8JIL6_SPIIN|nr:unnamed protein product [Spirodela intermedia]CAA6669979.1 unnamed protein product [Spirodela intermedia]